MIWNNLFLVFLFFPWCLCFEPISTAVGVIGAIGMSALYAGYDYTKCKRQECCQDNWIRFNYSGLVSSLKRSLHGQHLVGRIVTKVVKGHLLNKNPKKALVLAFHGSTGSGKNYVSKLIAEHLYVKGMQSEYVHLYIATQHFAHENLVPEYKKKLQEEIKEATELCGRSLYIFDEVDKMPMGIIDVLKPYMDYYDDVDGIDFRRNIFIFLSNAGGTEISKVALKFWTDGKEREDILMTDVEPLINKGAFNEEGGLKNSAIIKASLIDCYIPFLPLERKHVQLCIKDELRARFELANTAKIEEISNQLEYYPPGVDLYSESGCKKIVQKIDFYGSDDDDW